jgi:autotransporter-associated beta strand protein
VPQSAGGYRGQALRFHLPLDVRGRSGLLRQARVARPRSVGTALFTVSVVAMFVVPAAAADKVWTGASDSNFTTGTNWVGGIPGSADNALYDVGGGGTSADSNVNASININSISLQGGYAGTVTNTAAGTINFSTSISVSSGIFLNAGVLTGAGAFNVTGGAAALGGTSNYTGVTTIFGGGFVFANSTTGLSANSAFAIGSGGTLDLGGFNSTIGSLADVGGFGGSITNTSAGATAATLTTGGDNTSTSYAGTINDGNGALGLIKVGTGTMILANANGYSGGTTISGGTIQVTDAASLGTGAVTLDGGTYKLDTSVSSALVSNDFKIDTSGGTVDNKGAGGASLTLAGLFTNGNGGTGVLQLIDSGNSIGSVTILSGQNTYTGGTRVVDTTVQVTNSQSDGSGSVGFGTVTLHNAVFQADGNSDLTFVNNFKIDNTVKGSAIDAKGINLTIAGNISDGTGAGKLTVLDSFGGSGIVILTGINTYTGGTEIGSSCGCDLGFLQLGDATHTASIVGDVVNNDTFNIVNANTSGITSITNNFGTTTFYGSNSAGTATVTNQFGGSTIFLDSSTAGNATIINHGGQTLFGFPGGTDSSTAGNATIDNNNGGTIFAAQSNAGTAVITNRNGGGTIFGDQSSAASATITTNNHSFTEFGSPGGPDTVTAANAKIITNSGGLTEFNAFATAGNATVTTNNHGVTNFWESSNGGSATIVTNPGGQTYFNDTAYGDKARFITNGTGFLDFTFSAGQAGDGRITAGSIEGNGLIYIGGGDTVLGTPANTLVVGTNNLSTEFSGVIADNNPCGCTSGPASLEKVGTGTLTLSGINTYTGLTQVSGGTLLVTGSIASSPMVIVDNILGNGATLGGTGTVGEVFLSNGATLAPGLPTALGTLTVNDELLFCNCTFYNVKVTSGSSDLTQVVSTGGPALASLEGTVRVASLDNTYKFNSPYKILTAAGGFDFGGGATRFDSLVTPTGINGVLSYTTTDVNLTLMSALGQLSGLNINQRNVANALDGAFNSGGISGALGAIFNGNVPLNLTQVSGETATGSQQATFDAMNLFLSLMTDPFVTGRSGVGGSTGATPFADESGANAYAANRVGTAHDAFAKFVTKADVARNDLFDPRWSVWGSAYGGGSNTSGNGMLGSQSATARAFGFAAGADYRISPDTLVGFALAGGGTNFSVAGFGTGRSDLFQAGAFVRRNFGAAYVTAAAAYGWQDVTTDRTVTVAGVDRLRAEFNANAWSGRIEGGYRYATPWMGITPYAAGQFTTYSLPAYAEQVLSGAGTFALNYAAKDVTASRTEFGVRTDKSFAMQNAILTLRGRAAWAHDFNTDRNVTALFQTLPGASFVVNGAAQAHDSALVTAAAEMKWLNGFSLSGTFEGQFSSVTNSYAGKGVARYSW